MSMPSAVENLQLLLLGGFDVRWQGASLGGLSYAKMRALLVYLVMEPREHSREFLAELLWPDSDGVTARGNLRRTLADLRRVLPASDNDWFIATKNALGFTARVSVDARAFGDAAASPEARIALYKGEFAAGLSLPDCVEFENWLLVQRETLQRRALALLEQASNYAEARADHAGALAFALRMVDLEPWREEGYCRAMRLYAASGQQGAAFALYDSLVQGLKKELGVAPNEATRELIAEIRQQAATQGRRANAPVAPAMVVSDPLVATAERRQVTVLYCELSLVDDGGDPDDALALLQPAQAAATAIVEQRGGHVVQTHGGGFLAYFGFPFALESAARHAVQAGLALTQLDQLAVRVAIHSGLIITLGDAATPDTLGRTSKIAIQLRHHAQLGGVVMSDATHSLIAGYFDCAPLGLEPVRDFHPPVSLSTYRVLKETGAKTRLDAATRLTPMVGRQRELAQLRHLWEATVQGRGSAHLLQADGGFGKSRLLHSFKAELAGQACTLRELRCFPEFMSSPFHPLIAQLETLLGVVPGESSGQRFVRLSDFLREQHPTLGGETLPLLANLLSLSEGVALVAGLSPQQLKERTEQVLFHLLQSLAVKQPLLLIAEDLHWADPSSLTLLGNLLAHQHQGELPPILILLTARPDFVAPWPTNHCERMHLEPLPQADVHAMIELLADAMPAATKRHIVNRSDGVPLFVEELVKAAKTEQLSGVPARLHDLLMVRIDRLGSTRAIAQMAACLGREFELSVLQRVVDVASSELAEHLDTLQSAGLIQPGGQAQWQFRHGLIQDAAYALQTKQDRQSAHRTIAGVLASTHFEESQPEVLAQHWSAAGDGLKAIALWLKAGQRALRSSATQEAAQHFQAALGLLDSLPAGLERDCNEFAIWIHYSPVLYSLYGRESDEAQRANARVTELSCQVGDKPELFYGKWSQVTNAIASGSAPDDEDFALALQRLAALKDEWAAREASAQQDFEAISKTIPSQSTQLLDRTGTDLGILSASYLSCTLFFLGDIERATQVCNATVMSARAIGHPHTLASALCTAASFYRWLEQPQHVKDLAAEIIAISRDNQFPHWSVWGELSYGWAQVYLDEWQQGLARLTSIVDDMQSSVTGIPMMFIPALADAYMHANQCSAALPLLEEAVADLEKESVGGFHHAEIYRLLGECLLAISPAQRTQALAYFAKALAISQAQGAHTLVKRVQKSQSRLLVGN